MNGDGLPTLQEIPLPKPQYPGEKNSGFDRGAAPSPIDGIDATTFGSALPSAGRYVQYSDPLKRIEAANAQVMLLLLLVVLLVVLPLLLLMLVLIVLALRVL